MPLLNDERDSEGNGTGYGGAAALPVSSSSL